MNKNFGKNTQNTKKYSIAPFSKRLTHLSPKKLLLYQKNSYSIASLNFSHTPEKSKLIEFQDKSLNPLDPFRRYYSAIIEQYQDKFGEAKQKIDHQYSSKFIPKFSKQSKPLKVKQRQKLKSNHQMVVINSHQHQNLFQVCNKQLNKKNEKQIMQTTKNTIRIRYKDKKLRSVKYHKTNLYEEYCKNQEPYQIEEEVEALPSIYEPVKKIDQVAKIKVEANSSALEYFLKQKKQTVLNVLDFQ